MKQSILVVEDHDYLRTYTKKILVREGYEVHDVSCGKDALAVLRDHDFDLILMDLDLGDIDGSEIIGILRRQNIDTPIIVISNFEQIDTKVNAFDVGCDDYITKPFYKEELLARIRRMQKRIRIDQMVSRTSVREELVSGPFVVDFRDSTVRKNGSLLNLNRKMFDLLSYFINNRNRIITKEQLIMRFWDGEGNSSENTLSVHIHMLREQVEEDPRKPVILITKRGQGYILKISE